MQRIIRSLLIVFMTLGLASCSLFSGDEEVVRKPKPLTEFKPDVELEKSGPKVSVKVMKVVMSDWCLLYQVT